LKMLIQSQTNELDVGASFFSKPVPAVSLIR
jgi:hypothetical protein